MTDALPVKCPRCAAAMEPGFANKGASLSFISYDKFDNIAFKDEDLVHAGMANILPSRAAYFRSAVCRSCRIYLVDYSISLDRRQAEYLADPSRFTVSEGPKDRDLD